MSTGGRPRLIGFVFTVLLLGLILLAAAEIGTVSLTVMAAILLAAVGSFYLLFPGSNFFSISLTNFLGIYVCIFTFFVVTNFPTVAPWALQLGFTFPVVAFLGGALLRRKALGNIVMAKRIREERHLGRTVLWLIPVFGVGALTFLVPENITDPEAVNAVFLAAMGAIAAVVLIASRDIATFLLDAGLLFEDFFENAADLLVPTFAFFAFYTLQAIVFGCIYRILDRFSDKPQFLVSGAPETISFSDALYFSVITLSTVGYGEIVPATDSIRVIVSIQIVSGVLLLLFGFSEIISYARHRCGREPR